MFEISYDIATRFAALFSDPQFAHDVGRAVTCNEAETVAELLRAIGAENEALLWLTGHAQNDEAEDEGDGYHYLVNGELRYREEWAP